MYNRCESHLTPALRAHLDHYARFHQTAANKRLHFIGIPLFLIALFGLLTKLKAPDWPGMPWQLNAAWVALLLGGLWYVWTDWRVGLITLAVMIGCTIIGSQVRYEVLAILLTGGVVLHWIGHFVFEGKPPAVFSSLMAVLEAPAWLVAIATGLYR